MHQEKTLQKIAENRKRKAEETGEGFNPYEALFETQSGQYYMARLLNMPHLEQESEYMNHCVGTSDSYVNRIKKGDIEILSFRKTPTINIQQNSLQKDDTPLITFEYNLRTKTIQQMKKENDAYLKTDDSYYADVIDALKQLRTSYTDTGQLRDFKTISPSELGNITVKPDHVLTESGEMSLDEYLTEDNLFVLKLGAFEISADTPKAKIAKVLFLTEGIKIDDEFITTSISEINEHTKVYIGEWNPSVHNALPHTVEHIYSKTFENKVFRRTIELSTKTAEEYTKELTDKGYKISDYAGDMLKKLEPLKEHAETSLVSFTLTDLGFQNEATVQQIHNKAKEFGLSLCNPNAGSEMRLQFTDQKNGTYYYFAMEPISDRNDNPRLWNVNRNDDGETWLNNNNGKPDNTYNSDNTFVFSFSNYFISPSIMYRRSF